MSNLYRPVGSKIADKKNVNRDVSLCERWSFYCIVRKTDRTTSTGLTILTENESGHFDQQFLRVL